MVNDKVEVAIAANADGLHLGQGDIGISAAKERFGGIIGVSATTLAEAFRAQEGGAAYIGVGAMFHTGTKPDAGRVTFEEFRRIREKVSLPIYAIGGITRDDVKELKELGADGIAVISGILSAADPAATAKEMVDRWNRP